MEVKIIGGMRRIVAAKLVPEFGMHGHAGYACDVCGERVSRHTKFCPCCGLPLTEADSHTDHTHRRAYA